MRALRRSAPDARLALANGVVAPEPAPGEVTIQVTACGVCGSDLHIDAGDPGYAFVAERGPVTLGHEFVGVVLQGAMAGRRVVVRPSVTCGRCVACLGGRHDDCVDRHGIGMTRDGAFAPRVVVPERNCVPVPAGLPDTLAALTEPLTIARRAIEVAGPIEGRHVWVMGPGTIGQAIALFARAAGVASVTVTGRDDAVRLAALRAMGFDAVLDVAGEGGVAGLQAFAPAAGFDLVFEATGAPESIADAMPRLARRGTVVATGIPARSLGLDLVPFVRREQQLRGSFRAAEADWPRTLGDALTHVSALAAMVSHEVPLREATRALELARTRRATKVLLRPSDEDER